MTPKGKVQRHYIYSSRDDSFIFRPVYHLSHILYFGHWRSRPSTIEHELGRLSSRRNIQIRNEDRDMARQNKRETTEGTEEEEDCRARKKQICWERLTEILSRPCFLVKFTTTSASHSNGEHLNPVPCTELIETGTDGAG